MSSPAKRVPVATDRRGLQPYLKVQKASDKQIYQLLKDAERTINAKLKTIAGRDNISSVVQRDQLNLIKREILRDQVQLWNEIGRKVTAGRYAAAAAAVDSVDVLTGPIFERAGLGAFRETLVAAQKATARAAVDTARTRLETSKQELSNNVYKSRALSTDLLDRTINRTIASGGSARDIAKAVAPLINPNTPGGVSYAANRLGRTELNNAYHASQVLTMKNSPFVTYAQWNLSGSHPRPDACDDYASHSLANGQGEAGYWDLDEVPLKPHPQCLCFVTPVTISDDEFLKQYANGAFDDFLRTAA